MVYSDIEQAIEENMGLVNKFISQPRYELVDDVEGLQQACTIGLWKALEEYDESKNCKFGYFAYLKMHGEATKFLRDNHWMSGLKMQNSSEKPLYGDSTMGYSVFNGNVTSDPNKDTLFDTIPQDSDFTEDIDKKLIIEKAIKDCNFNEQQMVILRGYFWGDKSSKEIRESLGVSNAWFWMRMKVIKERLKEKLEGEFVYEN